MLQFLCDRWTGEDTKQIFTTFEAQEIFTFWSLGNLRWSDGQFYMQVMKYTLIACANEELKLLEAWTKIILCKVYCMSKLV